MKKLDELQYIKRGNVFKHCLFTIVIMLLAYVSILELDIIIISQRNALMLIVLFIVSLFCIEMICYEIYPLSEKRQKFIYCFAGLFGIGAIIAGIYEMVMEDAAFIESKMLTDAGTIILIGCLFIMVLIAYLLKKLYVKTKGDSSQ